MELAVAVLGGIASGGLGCEGQQHKGDGGSELVSRAIGNKLSRGSRDVQGEATTAALYEVPDLCPGQSCVQWSLLIALLTPASEKHGTGGGACPTQR